ncbi:efflux pump bik6 [Colletotrichum liriopes]|uniref:Efflux pump bik6 n=1 Tax=Colletotrichum liriopes TaxID=708192 RepID=A0AA37M0F3_9PEZI|nr:efflux pump bik6 [Colletotrichum liriopes]
MAGQFSQNESSHKEDQPGDDCSATQVMTVSMIVDFDGPADPLSPRNWSNRKKAIHTLLYGLTTMGSTFSSAIYSTSIQQVAQELHVGPDVSNLGTSMLLMGFGLGPLVWAPASEIYGRKVPMLLPYFLTACFTFGTATAKDIQTVLLTRFFAGFFGSAPSPSPVRGLALVFYAIAVVGGPVFGPVVGGALVQTQGSMGWRWTQYVTGIYMATIFALDVLLLDESYAPALLVAKAKQMRHQTRQWAWHAQHEERDPTIKEMTKKFMLRPLQLLGTPIGFLFSLHSSFVYSIVYLNLGAFPIVFQEIRGWNPFIGSLPFLALLVGITFGAAINFKSQAYYRTCMAANKGVAVPEARLPPMMIGSVMLAGGLFVMANTADPRFHWIAPVTAAAMMGVGFFTIFQAALNYMIDTFPLYGASAVAANTFTRSMLASLFPSLVPRIYGRMGIQWATNMLAFVAFVMIPIPWLFFYFGKRIRARGTWSRH